MDVPHIKLDDYYGKNIKDYSYDSVIFSVSVPYYDRYDGRSILIEREKIDCYFYGKSRVRFM